MADLPPHCVPVSSFFELVSSFFSSCIPTPLALLSTTFGLLSIVSWLFAQLPQIIKNHKRRSVDGLSLGFLAIWLAGDVCNFLGAVWTRQMWFQQVIGAYYVAVDCVLVGQWTWFTTYEAPIVDGVGYGESDESEGESIGGGKRHRRRTLSTGRSLTGTLIVMVSVMFHLAGASPTSSAPPITNPEHPYENLGRLLSWFSTLLYLSSRLPQLLMNFRRRSTAGLAITLFVAAFFGNLFYSFSLLLNPLGHHDYPPYGGGGIAGPDGSQAAEWWGRSFPFFAGAAGVLCMDAAVGWQWVVWGEGGEVKRGWWPWQGHAKRWWLRVWGEKRPFSSHSDRLLLDATDEDIDTGIMPYGTLQ